MANESIQDLKENIQTVDFEIKKDNWIKEVYRLT